MNLRTLFTANRPAGWAAAWIVLVCSASFWRLFFDVQGHSPRALLFAASLVIALLGLNLLLLRLLTPGRLLRPVLTVLLVLAAGAAWFMDTWGVALDWRCCAGWQTNAAEARATSSAGRCCGACCGRPEFPCFSCGGRRCRCSSGGSVHATGCRAVSRASR